MTIDFAAEMNTTAMEPRVASKLMWLAIGSRWSMRMRKCCMRGLMLVVAALASSLATAQTSGLSISQPYQYCNNLELAGVPRCVTTLQEIPANYEAFVRAGGVPTTCSVWDPAVGNVERPNSLRIVLDQFQAPSASDSGGQHLHYETSCDGSPWWWNPNGGGLNPGFYRASYCPAGTTWSSLRGGCYRSRDIISGEPRACPRIGNPIHPLTGVKTQEIELGMKVGGRSITLTYDTSFKLVGSADVSRWPLPATASFGDLWRTNLHKSITLQSSNGLPGAVDSSVLMQRGSGVVATASSPGAEGCETSGSGEGLYVGNASSRYHVTFSGSAATLVDSQAMAVESYYGSGAVSSVNYANGDVLTYTYSDHATPTEIAPVPGLLTAVADAFGRSVQFVYERSSSSSTARVAAALFNHQPAVNATYDVNGNLKQLEWADGSVRTFFYEHALGWPLTGMDDENQRRYTTYGYDAQGRVNSTEHANGVNRVSVSYISPPTWVVAETVSGDTICRHYQQQAPSGTNVTLPLGQSVALGATGTQGKIGLASQSQPAGSGCDASTSSQSYDPNGNVASRDHFSGTRTCYAYDLVRNLMTARVEGLSQNEACGSVTPVNAALPPNSRRASTQWHPDWPLETRVAEPGRITTSIYNGQPDPFNGNAVASCAPASALLPNGKPIAVLCKRVEQATTDANGGAGFSATLQSGVQARITSWTYNQWGQVLTENGPRTDVNDTTTYTYYGDTSFTGEGAAAVGHFMGDLATVTNAAGKVTQYTQYNKHGQVLESIDPNGVLTVNTYDLRQRLLSTTVSGQATSYQYDPVGQLKRVTLPDQSWVGYDYDDAHRQVAVYDHKGNRVDYQLDNAGNRIGEQTKDPGGALKRQLRRSIDALGRVQQTTGRE